MHRWQCPINNGTIEIFIWLSKQISLYVHLLKTAWIPVKPGVLCVQCELYTADPLHVSPKITEYFSLKRFLKIERKYLFYVKSRKYMYLYFLDIKQFENKVFKIQSVSVNLMRISQTTLISQRFKGNCCESVKGL